jgi:hypothetical protein
MNLKILALFVALSLSVAGCVTDSSATRGTDSGSTHKPKYPPIHPWEENCMKGPWGCGGG